MGFGDKLKAKRLGLGLSQAEFARRLGYQNNSYVNDVESNKYPPNEEKKKQWAKELGMTMEEMDDLFLEAELEELGINDPAFTMMFKDIPDMTYEEKQSIIRAYQAVLRARESKRKK